MKLELKNIYKKYLKEKALMTDLGEKIVRKEARPALELSEITWLVHYCSGGVQGIPKLRDKADFIFGKFVFNRKINHNLDPNLVYSPEHWYLLYSDTKTENE